MMVSVNDYYAYVGHNDCEFYYGYEVTDRDDNWCFEFKGLGQRVVLTREELGVTKEDLWDPVRPLLRGMAIIFERLARKDL